MPCALYIGGIHGFGLSLISVKNTSGIMLNVKAGERELSYNDTSTIHNLVQSNNSNVSVYTSRKALVFSVLEIMLYSLERSYIPFLN